MRFLRTLLNRSAWLLAGAGALLLASLVALVIGYLVYESRGRPQEHVTQAPVFRSMAFVNNMTAMGDATISGIQTGWPESFLLRDSRRFWQQTGNRALQSSHTARAVYQVTPDGEVSRILVRVEPVDANVLNLLGAHWRSMLGDPLAEAGRFEGNPTLARVRIYRIGERLIIFETQPLPKRGMYALTITDTMPLDVRYATRAATGGLPPWHPYADEVRRQIEDPNTRPEAVLEPLDMGPFQAISPGAIR